MDRESLPRILALWSAPRCRSTAFARMIIERGDYIALHEPFSHVQDFGEATVRELAVHGEAALIEAIRALARSEPVFFKDTTDFRYPGLLAATEFLAEVRHTFIVRHPVEAIASHYELNPALRRDEIGFAWLAEIYDAALAASGVAPIVIDSADLVRRPLDTVAAYCAAAGLPFLPSALAWQPGMRSEWQRTSRWHESTSSTTGFVSGPERDLSLVTDNPVLAAYLDYHLPFYERLRQAAVRP